MGMVMSPTCERCHDKTTFCVVSDCEVLAELKNSSWKSLHEIK